MPLGAGLAAAETGYIETVGARWVDEVVIAGSRVETTVMVPWESRQALLRRLRADGHCGDLIRALDVADVSESVVIQRSAKPRLLAVVGAWLDETNINDLPEGIFDLRNALTDDRDREEWDKPD